MLCYNLLINQANQTTNKGKDMNDEINLEQAEQDIEISIEAARGAVERKNSLEKLFATREFKDIFEDGYFKEEAARLVGLMTDPEFASKDRQEEIRNDMLGISATRQYLMNVHRLGVSLERQIASSESELQALRQTEED